MRSTPTLTLLALSMLTMPALLCANEAGPTDVSPTELPAAAQELLDSKRGAGDPTSIVLDEHWHHAAARWAERDSIPLEQALQGTRERIAASQRQRSSDRGAPIITVGGDGACDVQDNASSNGLQSALDAAATDSNGADLTIVRVAKNGFYEGRRYFINDAFQGDQTVTIVGGYDDCLDTTINGQTVINLGGAGGPAISIIETAAQQTVRLEHLTIREASSTTSDGGGVFIDNNNFVLMDFVTLSSNSANRGGAAFVDDDPDGIGTALWMLGSNVVRFNSAETEGGAFRCNGAATLLFDADVLISDNSAMDGGAIYSDSGCTIASYAGGDLHGIRDNFAAVDGGGVYLDGPGDTFNLIGGENSFFGFGDASRPALIDGNSSGRSGGAIYADGSGTQINATDSVISENIADADTDDGFIGQGGAVRLFAGASFSMDRTLSGTDCHDALRCSVLRDNQARFGAAISAFSGATTIDLRQTFVTGNSGPSNINVTVIEFDGVNNDPGNVTELFMEGNVIANNDSIGGTQDTISLDNVTTSTIAYTTITDNSGEAPDRAIRAVGEGDLSIYSSVIWEDTGTIFDVPWDAGINGTVDCLNTPASASLPVGASILEIESPGLRLLDYAPSPNAPALDTCDTLFYTPQEPDIAGNPRGFDLDAVPNRAGPYDLGAYELVEQIFPGEIEFVDGVIEVLEQDVVLNVTLRRVGGSDGFVGVQVQSQDGTAVAGTDYVALDDTINWFDGDVADKQVQLTILDDGANEGTETLRLEFGAIFGGIGQIGSPSSVQVTIFDDETTLFADGFEGG